MTTRELDQLCEEYGCFACKSYFSGTWSVYSKPGKYLFRIACDSLPVMVRGEIEDWITGMILERVL